MLARLRITTRINLTLLLGVIGTLMLTYIGNSILRGQMMDERQSQLRNLVDMSITIAREAMIAAGGPATEAGRKAFFSVLQSSHFGNEKQANYIFAYDYNGVVTILNDRSKIGQNRFQLTDANGDKFIQAIINTARGPAGEGFIKYMYEKGVGGPITPKLSYVKKYTRISGFGWHRRLSRRHGRSILQ
jgi:signal transduction histidine kinase